MSLGYSWQKFYEAAVLETDFRKMPDRIAKAEQAIQQRLSDSPPPKIEAAELHAIGNTLAALTVLKAQSTTPESRNGYHEKFAQGEELDDSTA